MHDQRSLFAPSGSILTPKFESGALSSRVIDYIESLNVTQGPLAGERVKLFPFQRRFIRAVFKASGQVPVSALSVARGAGKTTFLAALVACYIDPDGPLSGQRVQVYTSAASFEQARLLFAHLVAFIRQKHDLSNAGSRYCNWRMQDSSIKAFLEYRPTGARFEVRGSTPETLHGLSPSLFVLDEPSQLTGSKGEKVWNAIKTSLGKMRESKVIVIGTKPSVPTHFFARLLDESGVGMYSQVHAAGDQDNPQSKRTWLKACPALRYMPELELTYRREAREALSDEDALAQFRALRLNMGTDEVRMPTFLNPTLWASHAEAKELPERKGVCVWGLDLGQSASMSALAAYWPEVGRLEVVAALPERPHSLAKRSRQSGVPKLYESLVERHELVVYPEYTVPVHQFLEMCLLRFGQKPAVLVSDRYRQAELLQSFTQLRWIGRIPIHWRGMGYLHANEDVKLTKAGILDGKVKISPSLLMRSAIRASRIQTDPAGNEKLNKMYSKGHNDDALAATLLACGYGLKHYDPTVYKPQKVYLGQV